MRIEVANILSLLGFSATRGILSLSLLAFTVAGSSSVVTNTVMEKLDKIDTLRFEVNRALPITEERIVARQEADQELEQIENVLQRARLRWEHTQACLDELKREKPKNLQICQRLERRNRIQTIQGTLKLQEIEREKFDAKLLELQKKGGKTNITTLQNQRQELVRWSEELSALSTNLQRAIHHKLSAECTIVPRGGDKYYYVVKCEGESIRVSEGRLRYLPQVKRSVDASQVVSVRLSTRIAAKLYVDNPNMVLTEHAGVSHSWSHYCQVHKGKNENGGKLRSTAQKQYQYPNREDHAARKAREYRRLFPHRDVPREEYRHLSEIDVHYR